MCAMCADDINVTFKWLLYKCILKFVGVICLIPCFKLPKQRERLKKIFKPV